MIIPKILSTKLHHNHKQSCFFLASIRENEGDCCLVKVQKIRDPADVNFRSITIHGSLDEDILQQRLHGVARQREELQQMEIEFQARIMVRSEIMEMQNTFDAQIKEHADANIKLQV